MKDVTLRAMVAADLPDVMGIEFDSYSMPWTEITFRGLLNRRDADCVVAERAGMLLGYAVSWSVLEQCELGNVAVQPRWRGHGLGRTLVSAIIERARARRVREVFLEVRPSNPVAQKLYWSLGFEVVGRRRAYYQNPLEDALVMRLELDHSPQDD